MTTPAEPIPNSGATAPKAVSPEIGGDAAAGAIRDRFDEAVLDLATKAAFLQGFAERLAEGDRPEEPLVPVAGPPC